MCLRVKISSFVLVIPVRLVVYLVNVRRKHPATLLGHFLHNGMCQSKNDLFRLKPKSGFLTQSKNSFFDSLFSTEFSDGGIQSKIVTFSTGSVSRKTQSTNFARVYLTHRIAHPTTKHTPTRPYNTKYTTAPTLAWLSLLLLLAASQRGVFLVPLASSVNHTTTAARGNNVILSTTGTPAVALTALG